MTKLETDFMMDLKRRCDGSAFPLAVVDLLGRLQRDETGANRVVHNASPVSVRYGVRSRADVRLYRFKVVYANEHFRKLKDAEVVA